MTNQIQIFQFHGNQDVRVEVKDDEALFCLSDVAKILAIQNTNASRFNLDAKGVHKMYTLTEGGKQELTFISEPNLYRVIFRSNKAEAVKFQDWIFEEVIPAIRKSGRYEALPPALSALTPLDLPQLAQDPEARPSLKEERIQGLREAMEDLAYVCRLHRSDVHDLLFQRFQVDFLDELRPKQIATAF